MTRSVTIVNTSNWDGEDWVVKQRFKRSDNSLGSWDETTIKPGESMRSMIGSPNWEVEIKDVDSKEPEPFYFNGEQVLPQVMSWVGKKPNIVGG